MGRNRSFNLPDDISDWLLSEATRLGVSEADVLRMAVREKMRRPSPDEMEELLRSVKR